MSIRLLEPAQADLDETIGWYAQQAPGLRDAQGAQDMAETSDTLRRPLTPSPKALQKALKQSAERAQRLADAFGIKVPVCTRRAPTTKPKRKSKTII